jgi:hypothetical protein
VRLVAVSHVSGTRWRRCAAKMMVTGIVLAGLAAGCSGQPAVTGNSVTSCFQFAARAIQHHVTVTAVPAACRGLSQAEVNLAVSRALRAAAAGVRGKVRQRQIIARDIVYVVGLTRAIPGSSSPVVANPQPASRSPSHAALDLTALIAWLVTVGLGVSMMARWVTRGRHGSRPRLRGAVLNFTHFGLALTGLLAWISYLATRLAGLAWAACGLLVAAASLGMSLVFLAPATTAAARRLDDDPPQASHPPVLVIAAHITAACITILLAMLAAIGSG